MAKTEMAKSYEGIVTVRPATIERLQTVAEFVQQLNTEVVKMAMTAEYQAEISAISLKHKSAQATIAEIERTRDRRIAQRCKSIVETKWAVDFSDESAIADMTANEVLDLSNLDSRQLTGVRVTSSGASESGGLRFRVDTKRHNEMSRISILVTGQENDVQLVFRKLQEIAQSCFKSTPIRSNTFILYAGAGAFLALLEFCLLKLWKMSGHIVTETQASILLCLMIVSFSYGGTLLKACLSRLYPSWNCTIGDGDTRLQRVIALRQNWLQFGFGGVFLAAVVGYIVNRLSST